ncbi:MAG: M48 family metalloprotease [Vicinamibacterales bacterium]
MRRHVVLGAVLALALAAPAASEAQFGRIGQAVKRANQLRDLQVTDEEEQSLGRAVSERLRQRYGVVQDAAVTRYVSLVGTVLARAGERPGLPWTFIVLDVPSVNAFAAPGGYIHITRGALGLIRNEAELAGVLGHEIIHVTGKHTIRAIQKSKAVQMGADETLSGNAALFDRVVTATFDNIVNQAFSRSEELESDEKGVRLANTVGYAPQGLGAVLTRIKDRNSASTEKRGMFASHPEMQERIDKLAKLSSGLKPAGTATVEARYAKTITYTPTALADITVVADGAAGLAGGQSDGTAETAKKDEAPKKRGLGGLANMVRPGGAEKTSAQASASGGSRGLDPERDAKGGGNPKPVPVKIADADLQKFKQEGGLK